MIARRGGILGGLIVLLVLGGLIYLGFAHFGGPEEGGTVLEVKTSVNVEGVKNVEIAGEDAKTNEGLVTVNTTTQVTGWTKNPVTWGWNMVTWGVGIAFWFWIFVFVCIELYWERNDDHWACFFTFLGTIIFFGIFAKSTFNPFAYICHNPWVFFGYVALYILIGFAWSVFKWCWRLHLRDNHYEDLKDTFKESHSISGKAIPDEKKAEFKKYLNDSHDFSISPPRFKDSIDEAATWLLWWPFSMVITICGDILAEICRDIIRNFDILFNFITNIYQKKINKDIGDA